MEMHNLQDYKSAKTVLPHINAILHIVNLSIRGLNLYRVYIPVNVILHTLQEQKTVLEIYQMKYKKILEMKGRKP